MRIALDYDGTYTKAPELWNKFIADVKKSGNEIICVTMRYDDEDERLPDSPIKVYYTGRLAKAPFMQNLGIKIDIWIDDNPMWIFYEAGK